MVAIPDDDGWQLERLQTTDGPRVLELLEREPLLNAYLISRLTEEGIRPDIAAGASREGILRCVGTLGASVVMSTMAFAEDDEKDQAMGLFAERILRRAIQVRAMISDSDLVGRLWRQLERSSVPPTVIRHHQPVYALMDGADRLPDLDVARYARQSDLTTLVPACALMHREEVGIDPLLRDPSGYRERVRDLVQKNRAFVIEKQGHVIFKAEIAAMTKDVVQLMGVWTSHRWRNQGWGRIGMSEVCGHLLRRGFAVTLFVNDFNTTAIHLYESMGFRVIGENRSLIW